MVGGRAKKPGTGGGRKSVSSAASAVDAASRRRREMITISSSSLCSITATRGEVRLLVAGGATSLGRFSDTSGDEEQRSIAETVEYWRRSSAGDCWLRISRSDDVRERSPRIDAGVALVVGLLGDALDPEACRSGASGV
jgi:ABC-type molybdenum transport system ATPase subunit/photorepair protein PhrA